LQTVILPLVAARALALVVLGWESARPPVASVALNSIAALEVEGGDGGDPETVQMSPASIASQFSALFQGKLLHTQPLLVGTIPLVHAVLEKIGFHEILERWSGDGGDVPVSKAVEALVQARVAGDKTVPLSQVGQWACKTMLPQYLEIPASKLNDTRLGRVLELVYPQLDHAWYELVAGVHREFGLDCSFTIYDVTSVYFEGEYSESAIVNYGYSRDGKPNSKQINVGVNVTGPDGIPLAYATIPGNVNDTATVRDNMLKIRRASNALGLTEKLVAVGDRAMLTPELMHAYKQSGIDFVGTMADGALQRTLIGQVPDSLLMLHPLPYVAERFQGSSEARLEQEKYYAYRVSVRIPVDEKGPDGKAKKRKKGEEKKTFLVWALVVLACGKQRLDAQKRETLLGKCEGRLAEIAGMLNSGRYKKLDFAQKQVDAALTKWNPVSGLISAVLSQDADGRLSLSYSRDEEAIRRKALADGKYVIFFTDGAKTDAEIFACFKRRDIVERRMGNLKGPLPVRPIYLHNDERILGLIFVTMVALLVSTVIEMQLRRHQLSATCENVQGAFSRYGASLLTFEDCSQVITMPAPDKWQKQILAALDVAVPPIVPVLVPDAFLCEATAPTPSPWSSGNKRIAREASHKHRSRGPDTP